MADSNWKGTISWNIIIRRRILDGEMHITCPFCSQFRKKRHELCASIHVAHDDAYGLGHCMHCGASWQMEDRYEEWVKTHTKYQSGPVYTFHGFKRDAEKEKMVIPKNVKVLKPTELKAFSLADAQPPKQIADYFEKRCWSLSTISVLDIRWEVDSKHAGRYNLVFPYFDDGVVRNVQHKVLNADGSKSFFFETGGTFEVIPYNVNALRHFDTIVIVEGPSDVVAAYNCGIRNVISVGNGAQGKMDQFARYQSLLDNVKTFIIAGDMDEPGIFCRHQLIDFLGAWRCKEVNWPANPDAKPGDLPVYKDLNEVLMAEGADVVNRCIAEAKQVEISGIINAKDVAGAVHDYWSNGIEMGKTIDIPGFDEICRFELGRFYVFTGLPGSGKSAFADYIILFLAIRYDWKALVFSPEKYPVAIHYFEYAQMIVGREFRGSGVSNPLDEKVFDRTMSDLNRLICHIDADRYATIDEILDRAIAKKKSNDSFRVLLIDPAAYIRHTPGNNPLDEENVILDKLIAFAHQYQVLVILVAHPRKPGNNGRASMSLYEISGTGNIYNKCDVGVILEKDELEPQTNMRTLKVEKMRWDQNGRQDKCLIYMDKMSRRWGGYQTASDGKPVKVPVLRGNLLETIQKEGKIGFEPEDAPLDFSMEDPEVSDFLSEENQEKPI